MSKVNHQQPGAVKRRLRVRAKFHGTAERPRLSVNRSNKHMFIQAIDDVKGITLFSGSDHDVKDAGTKTEKAVAIAKLIAEKAKKSNVTKFVFDRGSYRYHGRVKAVADTLREQGIQV